MEFLNTIQVGSMPKLSKTKGNERNQPREKEDAPNRVIRFSLCLFSLWGWIDWLKLELLVE